MPLSIKAALPIIKGALPFEQGGSLFMGTVAALEGKSVGEGSVTTHSVEDFLPLLPKMPLCDVRSPAEFTKGHISGAVNLPLFDNAERAEVGTLYVQKGRQEAILRGLAFAGPKLESLVRFALACQPVACAPPQIALHCWRGGLRSNAVAWLLQTAGFQVHVLRGGYKAFRRFALASFEQSLPLVALGGRTGSGKTETLVFLERLGEQVVDLEGLARHRGSAFGGYAGEAQPSCEHFENSIAMALLRCDVTRPIWVEDESENLGTVNQPRAFYNQLRAAPLVLMETPEDARLVRVLQEYGSQHVDIIAYSLDRIQKRMGGLEHSRARAALAEGDISLVAQLLLQYYDRAYARQTAHRAPVATVSAHSPEDAAAKLVQAL